MRTCTSESVRWGKGKVGVVSTDFIGYRRVSDIVGAGKKYFYSLWNLKTVLFANVFFFPTG